MTVFKYAMLRSLRSPVSYLGGFIAPIALILLMANTWTYTPAVGLGFLVTLMMLSAHLMAALILEDRIDGSIIKILISPVSMKRYIFQNLLAAIIPLLTLIVLLVLMGYFRYGWTLHFVGGVWVLMLTCTLATAAFAFCWNMFFNSKNSSNYSYLFLVALVMLLSGLMVPTEALPGFAQHVGAVFHLYWFTRALIALVEYGTNAPFWLYNAIMMMFAIVFLLIGGRRRKM